MTWSEIPPYISQASNHTSQIEGEWNAARVWNDWPHFMILIPVTLQQ